MKYVRVRLTRIAFQDAVLLEGTVIPSGGTYGDKRSLGINTSVGPPGKAVFISLFKHILTMIPTSCLSNGLNKRHVGRMRLLVSNVSLLNIIGSPFPSDWCTMAASYVAYPIFLALN